MSYSFYFAAEILLDLNELKQENLENHATLNHVFELEEDHDQFPSSGFIPKEKQDDVLEAETRGMDFKGNVRYFCPKCNVRYIGKIIKLTFLK